MNYDEYMKKIQYIANILEQNKYAENIINSKDIDVVQDFQYICLSNASNPELVNEIIARLAQNGNESVVLKNIKNISMEMWKDLFNKNKATKKMFIENYNTIFENTSILTFRELEKFIDDPDTRSLIYGSFDSVIKKLCTYDRAAFIALLKSKPDGVNQIHLHIQSFFQKGEYDISTTYSKVLIELSKIESISKLEILNACSQNLTEMLNRETAIDNETNKLLNWLYDTFEETKMIAEDRADIKNNIDKAILQNFEYILDKSNYDKNTIKILKQFDCTRAKFENNKNHYIDKSNKANNEDISYTINISNMHLYSNKKDDKIPNIVPFEANKKIEDVNENNDEVNLLELFEIENEEKYQDKNSNIINFKEEKNKVNYMNSANEFKTLVNQDKLKNNELKNENFKINEINLADINKEKNDTLDESIKKLIVANIEETDRIIEKALKKDKIEEDVEHNYNKFVKNLEPTIQKGQNVSEQVKTETIDSKEQNEVNEIQKQEPIELIATNENLDFPPKENLFKRIWNKIAKLLKISNAEKDDIKQ